MCFQRNNILTFYRECHLTSESWTMKTFAQLFPYFEKFSFQPIKDNMKKHTNKTDCYKKNLSAL